ncbi:MAG: PBP1A family penicillin-binding protein [Actinomycetes bacterium]|jgi:1A family penicillin-binding protein|nr:PBP1A family penicillin-binding protein [Actinomycetes bacterium]
MRHMRARAGRAQATKWKISGAVIALFAVVTLVVVFGVGAIVVTSWLKDLPDYKAAGAFDASQPTKIYSADGKLLARLYLENRESIPLKQMSPWVLDAIVAVEDERFYQHPGVDLMGILRSVVKTAGGNRQGASTLTQQYIRQTILLDEATEISLKRKVREAWLALELEKRYSKEEILAMYLNTVYFGEGAYGIQIASQTYFAKNAQDLTIAEAAMLAGLPQRPGKSSPYDYPDIALNRRNQVLERMRVNGYITQAEYDEALQTPVKLKKAKSPNDGMYASPYFAAQVIKELKEKFSTGTIFGGGLTVITTLDDSMQKDAEKAVSTSIGKKGPEGALVSIDPSNGFVKALVGGRNYKKNKFNMATQAHRQAGSSFKTFTLTTALDEGMSPGYMVDSASPATIPTKPKPWVVNNSEGQGHGLMSLQSATAGSVNTVFARVAHEIGAKKIVKTAKAMGIKTKLKAYDSIALGAQNVTVLEMASAYATLANNGVYHEPTFITEVRDRTDQTIYEWKEDGKRVISKEVAYATTRVLQSVVSGGTGTRARVSGWQVAGKTGTSQKNRDVWFCGYTPTLATAVWVGWPAEKTIILNGSRAFGGTVCAPIWQKFMVKALKETKHKTFKTAAAPKYNNSKFHIPRTRITVPNTEGSKLAAAKRKLGDFKVVVREVYSDKPKGTVVNQRNSGSTVYLDVSKGPDPKKGGGKKDDEKTTPNPPPSTPTTSSP